MGSFSFNFAKSTAILETPIYVLLYFFFASMAAFLSLKPKNANLRLFPSWSFLITLQSVTVPTEAKCCCRSLSLINVGIFFTIILLINGVIFLSLTSVCFQKAIFYLVQVFLGDLGRFLWERNQRDILWGRDLWLIWGGNSLTWRLLLISSDISLSFSFSPHDITPAILLEKTSATWSSNDSLG